MVMIGGLNNKTNDMKKILKDYFVNLFLQVRFWLVLKGFLKNQPNLKDLYGPSYSQQNFIDLFNTGMYWGRLHPDYPHQAMTDASVQFLNDGVVNLNHLKYQGTITHNGKEYAPSFDAGCIYGKYPFKYGRFSALISLPDSNDTWPAFWFSGVNSWPPEIDVAEFQPGNFKNGIPKMSCTIHTGTVETRRMFGKSFRLHDYQKGRPFTVTFEWMPNYIAWYYNGMLFRKLTQERVLRDLRQDMYLIFGSGIVPEPSIESLQESFVIWDLQTEPFIKDE